MKNKNSYLITGGTGSFGKAFVHNLVNSNKKISRLVIFSRDELKQYEMAQLFPVKKYPFIRFFLGDVRDAKRVVTATEDIETIIHAAALKQVPTTEYNPFEAIKTNIIGANNVIEAALINNVKNVIALSTDKACSPINLYGASKLVSDKLFIAANNIKGDRNIRFSAVRYGNVMGSRGSVIPFFINKRNEGLIPITHQEMTRFNISLQAGVDLVMFAIGNHLGGEIFIPKIPSYKILDIAKAIAPNTEIKVVGIRPGEKLHEEMITETDSLSTIDLGKYYAILPSVSDRLTREDFIKHHNAVNVELGFKYNSGTNTEWESVDSLRKKIVKYVDPKFTF